MRSTDGRGVDVVVDGIGSAVTEQSFACTAYEARDLRKVSLDNMRMNKTIVGASLTPEFATPRVIAMIEQHIADVASGELRGAIDRSFPLEDAGAAHAYIERCQAFGRVLPIS